MAEFFVDSLRGELVESRHRVSVAVTDHGGRLLAQAHNPHLVTFLRSAAKPFQTAAVVADGAADHFQLTPEELALAAGSHNSEPAHVELVRRMLGRLGFAEENLACRPHRPLWKESTRLEGADRPSEAPPTPAASNCSGKHAAMLALAKHHGWSASDYQRRGHPVQNRMRAELAGYAGVPESNIGEGLDGCGVVAFALPLARLARAYGALLASNERAACRVVEAMRAHPELVAGRGRLCTALIRAYPGAIAKVGADGVYCVAFREPAVAVALKVEDGSNRAALVALVRILDQLEIDPPASRTLPDFAEWPLTNTRGESSGVLRARGALAFL